MQHKILFTADVHGNKKQYKKLVERAIETEADSVIIGGDIAPKGLHKKNFIIAQRHFLEKELPELLRPIKKKLPNSRVFLMMGNDDCAANLDVLESNDPNLFRLIHGKRLKLTHQFDITGYAYVPITRAGIKDWEKFDLSEVPAEWNLDYRITKATNYKFNGYKSKNFGWEKFRFTPEMEKEDSIQKDLTDESFHKNTDKTLYVSHVPPYKTNLDHTYNGNHHGSIALRLFIEKHQPLLTLHGHIHETAKRSGDYRQQIGKTLCLSASNHNVGSELAFLEIDMYKISEAKRLVI